jgi:hypothetical protein
MSISDDEISSAERVKELLINASELPPDAKWADIELALKELLAEFNALRSDDFDRLHA